MPRRIEDIEDIEDIDGRRAAADGDEHRRKRTAARHGDPASLGLWPHLPNAWVTVPTTGC